MKNINVRINVVEYERLKALSSSENISPARLVRDTIRDIITARNSGVIE